MKLFKPSERDDDLVTLQSFDDSISAHSLRLLLESNGIRASVTGEESTALFGNSVLGVLSGGAINIQVSVRRSDFEEAKMIAEEVPAAAEVLIPEWICQCGEDVDAGFSVCWSCGQDWNEPEFL